ncbi:pyridoxamine 5'-phosphate oxidase family protein [Mucilaginibacter myungsuensis]|uniref:Pyridoxamine 5'-phosphate oxidase family protein n=1 Tax=Mucilaginibacter myungsuensis TaxID=649104 RepID=A0A929KTG6_9SPHI|nr:pyridoxamine 5'-phosphate oxidase family protein [Mucilaginibacter myungsuensis]MBE9661256.1 pyridoxamine 5'-phosphate oxidase family protein [Mucilaginibacter myungsuensis]MDN3597399.1 pyridoxamine 5'-phosphate oxidase family protein [Mucilaginibacter myungsuensis]
MGKFFDEMTPAHAAFIQKQKMYFVATAPLQADGHVNLSPKGMDSFRVLSPTKVVYMDIVGSGNETSAHILENGRITLMFCAYDGPPNILRLYGTGRTVLPGDAEWEEFAEMFDVPLAIRQFIVSDVHKVQTSCGFSVPYYEYVGERDHGEKWAQNKGAEGLEVYKREKNLVSLDGLPTALAEAQ